MSRSPGATGPNGRHHGLAVILVLGSALMGCSGAPDDVQGLGNTLPLQRGDPADLTRVDSAGVQVIQSRTPRWQGEAEAQWHLAAVPEAVIRSPDASPDAGGFIMITDVVALSDGRIVVADQRAGMGFLFDREGRPTGRFGGIGGGPGELWGIASVYSCDADSLYVGSRGDLNVFGPDGEYVRRVKMIRSDPIGLSGVAHTCDAYVVRGLPSEPPLGRTGFGYTTFAWTDATFGPPRPFAEPVPTSEVRVVEEEGGPISWPLPWTSNWATGVGVGTDRVVTGFGKDPELRLFGSDGLLEEIVRWRADPDPVTAQDRRLYAERRSRFLDERGSSAEARAIFPPLNEIESVPAVKPVFDGLLVDDEDHIWVHNYPAQSVGSMDTFFRDPIEYSPERWTVINPKGVWLGSLAMPEHFKLYAVASGRVYGVQTDSLGVASVTVFEILR